MLNAATSAMIHMLGSQSAARLCTNLSIGLRVFVCYYSELPASVRRRSHNDTHSNTINYVRPTNRIHSLVSIDVIRVMFALSRARISEWARTRMTSISTLRQYIQLCLFSFIRCAADEFRNFSCGQWTTMRRCFLICSAFVCLNVVAMWTKNSL